MQFGTTYVLFAATGITTFSASCPSCHVGPIPARAAFVDVKGGLMGEASIGGQKFSYQPL
jgi:hypothetical protein